MTPEHSKKFREVNRDFAAFVRRAAFRDTGADFSDARAPP